MRKLNIESIKQKILESSVTRDNIFALLESVENKPILAYHVTFASNLNSIRTNGLKNVNKSNFPQMTKHAKKGIFFATCEDDVSFWFSKFEELATANSDDFVKDLMVPVVLKFTANSYEIDDVAKNEDHRHCSYYTNQAISSSNIEFYFGKWTPVTSFERKMANRALDDDGYFQSSSSNPFYPFNKVVTESTENNLPAEEYYDLEDELLKNNNKTPEQIIQGWKNVDNNYYGIEEDFIKTHCCGIIHKIKFENKWYVLFDRDLYEIEEIIDNYERYSKKFPFIGEIEDRFNNDFWDSPKTLYHATDCENVKSILQNGLKGGYGTGLMNTGTFGIYTSLNPEGYIESYGDCVIAIDCGRMVEDEFKPFVNQEPDVVEYEIKNALSHLLDYEMEFDAQNDTDPDTVIVTAENIPAKYLKLVKGSLKESIEKPLEEVYSENNSALLRYVKDEDIDISEHPFDLLFHDWMYDHDEEALREFEDEHSWDDWQAIEARFPKEIKMFKEAVKNGKYNDDPDVVGKTKVQMSLQGKQLLPRTTWLVHFSKYADEIAREGFTSGAEDMTDMALTVFNRGVKRPGYNFAFIADSRYANRAAASPYGRRNGAGKYGEDAVMFMNSGVHFYHSGDEEDQIVFYGQEANDFVLLKYDDGKYSVKGNNNYKGHDYIFSPNEDANSFEQCVKWVKENWRQYRNVLFHHVKQSSNNHQNLTESISIKIIDDED
jgi:hypothetical protein